MDDLWMVFLTILNGNDTLPTVRYPLTFNYILAVVFCSAAFLVVLEVEIIGSNSKRRDAEDAETQRKKV